VFVCVCVWVCVYVHACSLSYPTCTVHGPYYIVICGLSDFAVFFPHYPIKAIVKKLFNRKYMFRFSLKVCLKHSRSKNNRVKFYHKCTYVFR